MSAKRERSELRRRSSAPPLGGDDERSEERGGSQKDAAEPLRWYLCVRCHKYVLSFKRTRGVHNKKCPPWNDPVDVLASLINQG